MKELALKYGCNPNQKPSRIYMEDGNSWQLVKELKEATGMPAAASFKHVSPAGAAIGLPLSDTLKKIYFVDDLKMELSPLACAYARARGADRMCSYGDFVALSDTCDAATATLIKREVSDGVIAPGYTPEAIEILKSKRKGTYNVIQINPGYKPAPLERKQVFGITFEQGRNEVRLDDPALFQNVPTQNKEFTPEAKRCLLRKRRASHRHWRRPAKPCTLHATGWAKGRHVVASTVPQGDEPSLQGRHPPRR